MRLDRVRKFGGTLIMYVCRIFPIKKNKVILVSYNGKGYGDGSKAVTEALLNNHEPLDIVWAVKPQFKDTLPDQVRYVKFNSLQYLYELSTAKVWVDNVRKSKAIVKRYNQFYIQLWHGCYALKKIEKDVENHLGRNYVASAKHDSKLANLMVSGSAFFTNIIRRAFWYNGEILECGSPRIDSLFNPKEGIMEAVCSKLGIEPNQKIILYAPTFRNDYNVDCYSLNYSQIRETLKQTDGIDYTILVRLHPNVSNKDNLIEYNEHIINASKYPDINELILASDIIITDYSSVMFEAAMIGKPVFLFATDIDEYSSDRGFYFDIRNLPFPLSQSNDELINNILSFNQKNYEKETEKFFATLQPFENGTAARQVADQIIEVIGQ